MNFSTTCLRYSKFISLESFKSELLVTVTEALGTSEFARSSGNSLSGLIFYKKKKKTEEKEKYIADIADSVSLTLGGIWVQDI